MNDFPPNNALELTRTAITMGFVNTTSIQTLMRMFVAGTLKLDTMITHGKFVLWSPYVNGD